MSEKTTLPPIPEKIGKSGEKENGKMSWYNLFTGLLANPRDPDKIGKVVQHGIKAAINFINRRNGQLKEFETEATNMRKEGDKLNEMVQANWQGIKKCTSEEMYLVEEQKIAQALEVALLKGQEQQQKQQQKQLGS